MTKPQRILLNGSHPDYLLNLRGDLIKAFVEQGHEIHVTSPNLDERAKSAIERLGGVSHEVAMSRRGLSLLDDLRYFRVLRQIMKKIKPDFVLSYTIKPNIWGSLAAGSLGIPSASMVTGLGYAFTSGGGRVQKLIGLISPRLYRWATFFNRVVIFQNADDCRDFVKAGALADPGKARFVNGSGVNVEYFSPAPLPETPSFLMIARLLGNKGPREYATAAAQLIEKGLCARFMLAGFLDEGVDAVSQQELDAWRRQGIQFLGKLGDVRPALARANVYVLPSYREGTPRTVLEAMAMGRPVITTDVPGCRETVVIGETGILVPARDVSSLAAAMELLACDINLRRSMGAKAREFCVATFAVERVNKDLIEHLGLEPQKNS